MGCPAEVFAEVLIQRRATAAVARVEEEILHVDRDVFLGAAQLIAVGAAHELAIVLFALASSAHVLLPPGQVEQAWVVAQGEATLGLPAAFFRQADLAQRALLALAACNQRILDAGPQAGTVVEMGELVQHGGQQLFTHRAMWAVGALSGGAAIGEAGQQAAVELEGGYQ
ncbi:hypothetical protein D9M71_262980 [compost metagenome]